MRAATFLTVFPMLLFAAAPGAATTLGWSAEAGIDEEEGVSFSAPPVSRECPEDQIFAIGWEDGSYSFPEPIWLDVGTSTQGASAGGATQGRAVFCLDERPDLPPAPPSQGDPDPVISPVPTPASDLALLPGLILLGVLGLIRRRRSRED